MEGQKKRIITEARQEQNRQAQRTFRRRRKEKKGDVKHSKGVQRHRSLRPLVPWRDVPAEDDGVACIRTEDHDHQTVVQPTLAAASLHIDIDEDLEDLILSSLNALHPTADALAASSTGLSERPESLDQSGLHVRHPSTTSRSSEDSPWNSNPYPQQLLADPYTNLLSSRGTTIFSAFLHNALALNFDLVQLSACAPSTISPFYRPSCSSDDPAMLLSSALSNLSIDVPLDLRPTLTQIIVPHHASLDLVPLPLLRDRAIMLSAAMPQMFNIWELKRDIYERGGLTIWGHSSQPADAKNWEAATWFLGKWSLAVDGEEGELGRQSRWWRALKEQSTLLPWASGVERAGR